jgi:hypothetical protein
MARTVVPEISDAVFETIEVTFSPNSGDPITKTMTKVTETFYLPPGTYNLAVTGKKGGNSIAVGAASSVIIDEDTNKTAKATVLLSPETGGAPGTFGYIITLPSVNVARLTRTDAGGNPFNDSQSNPVNAIDLKSGTTGTVENLLPGEYRLKVFLEKKEGDGETANVPPEVVYIYSTLTSTFTYNFSDITLIKTKGPLEMTLSFGPSTIAAKDGELSYQKGASSTFTLTVSTDDFTDFSWNLDGTVLNNGENGVNGNTYSPLGTLKAGTHFVTAAARSKANNAYYSEIVQFTVTP